MGEEFAGKIVVVTGAASGIGNSVAEHFAQRGARVVGVDRDETISASMAALPGEGHHAIAIDLTADAAASTVIREVVEVAGGLHVLVNSAGSRCSIMPRTCPPRPGTRPSTSISARPSSWPRRRGA